jgi:hypothetical protein
LTPIKPNVKERSPEIIVRNRFNFESRPSLDDYKGDLGSVECHQSYSPGKDSSGSSISAAPEGEMTTQMVLPSQRFKNNSVQSLLRFDVEDRNNSKFRRHSASRYTKAPHDSLGVQLVSLQSFCLDSQLGSD